MLSIDRLRLALPAGYEHRAADIVRRVGEHLGNLDTTGMRPAASLSLPVVRIAPGTGDAEMAATIATAIVQGIRRHR